MEDMIYLNDMIEDDSQELPHEHQSNEVGDDSDNMLYGHHSFDELAHYHDESIGTHVSTSKTDNDVSSMMEMLRDKIDHHDKNLYSDDTNDIQSEGNISFGSASSWQDSGFQEFKNYLYYHCHINSSEIPHTHDLINYNGDYDHATISKLETWVRKLHASNKISNYDEDQLFKYLNRMK